MRLWQGLLELARGLRDVVYPGVCGLCDRPGPTDPQIPFLCPACKDSLSHDPTLACPRCACVVGSFTHLEDGCPNCRSEGFAFDAASCFGLYKDRLRELVLRMKHHSAEGLAEMAGTLWASLRGSVLAKLDIEVVVPVPLHWWRRLTRGYNQSEALARSLAEGLSLPCWPGLLRRIRHTPHQSHLSAAQRRVNVAGAFRASAAVRGLSVLLVDDVMTTGATSDEAARALKAGGASRVVAAALARATG